jgi:L-2-hydroxyglutarate oxidase LhgO
LIDVAIIGGGIVGLATAYQLLCRRPGLRVVVLEKEAGLARHQSGRNSGVLHAGLYYAPGSAKARLCREGKAAMIAFCRAQELPFEICGKVVAATDEGEVGRLRALAERGRQNGVELELIDRSRLREIEPHAAGVEAIHVRESGITDYRLVCARLAELVGAQGHEIRTGTAVTGMRETGEAVVIETAGGGEVRARYAVACAGLHADRLARLAGLEPGVRLIPFRGEYYHVRAEAAHVCRNLIYPVPDPQFPFLGVHFTRMIGGGVECGPNAVFAFAREGYRWRDVRGRDLAESLAHRGFQRLAGRHWRMGLGEMWRSANKGAFTRALQRLVPEITAADLTRGGAGVRAQAVGPDGQLLSDFAFQDTARTVHVINAPSPAATASLAIGRAVVERLEARMR